MSFLGKLFGTDAAATELVKSTASGLDYLFHTGQEKSEEQMEMTKFAGNMFIEWQKNTQGQNLARRILALSIAFTWLAQYWASGIVNIMAANAPPDETGRLERISEAIGGNADAMTGAMMLLLGFYFAAPHMDKIVGAAMTKFSKVDIGKNDKPKNEVPGA